MSIKIKNRDPKKTDFASDEIVINRKDGTLFFKSEKNLIKLEPSSTSSGDTSSSDNLGNHTATQDLNLSDNNITNVTTGSFGRIETLTISASTGDFDASTIRIGGEDFNRANLIALKEGRSIQTSSQDLAEGDSSVTNLFRVEAVMSVDDNSTYAKMKGSGRVATFISGTLFQDLQKTPTENLARIGDGDTNLLFSGSIVSASINGGFF
tara:strand:- start:3710 stop:4336 length:627 start_codon:yes stop_codon:yes gene_type:complete